MPYKLQKQTKDGPSMKTPKISAKQHALYLINRREYSQKELLDVLVRKGHDEDKVQNAIKQLSDMDIQSDKRTAKALVRQGEARGDGPVKIAAKGRMKGLCEEEIKDLISNIDFLERAQDLVRRKYGVCTKENRDKALRHLLGKGYSMSVALEAIKPLSEE